VRWKLLIGLAGVTAVVAAFAFASRSVNTRVLKDGHRLHLNCLLFDGGSTVEVRDPSVTLVSQLKALLLRKRVPKRWQNITNRPPNTIYPEVWLEIERAKGEQFKGRHLRAEIHLPGGQIIGSRFSGGSRHECGRDIFNAHLPALPTTVKRLDLRIVVDDESFQFDLANPAYRKLSALPPLQTLPHTEARGDLVASLDGFTMLPLKDEIRKERGNNYWVKPDFHLWWNGNPADDWFDKQYSYGTASVIGMQKAGFSASRTGKCE
jgi:hypothetical protein